MTAHRRVQRSTFTPHASLAGGEDGSSQAPNGSIRSLLPYLWPKGDIATRARVVGAMLFLIAAKLATVMVPIYYARSIDVLSHHAGRAQMLVVPVALILAYGGLRIASGAFGELRDAVFARVKQRIVRRVSLQTFRHLHSLSLRFHLDRQTGGISRAIERGQIAIEAILRLGVFNIVPTLVEAVLVAGFIWVKTDWRFALVVMVAIVAYIGFTLGFTTWRMKIRRAMNEVDSEASSKAIDSLLNYETVKYFGNEAHEARRFDEAQQRYERAAVRTQVSLNALNIGQQVIISVALAAVMLMAARGVVAGHLSVGKFVLVNTYLMQLYLPLNFLGFVYGTLRQSFVDVEQMFRLLSEPQEVSDRPGAAVLEGHLSAAPPALVRFENVRFGYRPDREILRGVSFAVPAGGKLAIVGPTGAGKSTISRLLFRFYDVTEGAVTIDGADLRDVSQTSLRAAIGVVPQDTVLFNDTVRYNIAYGRIGASQDQIEQAARLAQVHDFIVSLPEGYETRVGERGLKLSGGEKQRVAIARTILKDPRVLILDEATSALDTATEREIEAALKAVSARRTTLVIAHRLSTVVDADEILVLDQGAVVERGTHAGLLLADGLYATMWRVQAEAAEENVPV